MATPHINCEPGDIAPLVLMPGDPRRADRIARDYLTGARVVSDVRGIQTWTGSWQGTPMSVMASGMGIPSISIYATELYRFFGVRRICRVGTIGGISSQVKVRDVVIAASAHTTSSVAALRAPEIQLSLAASYPMLRAAVDAASDMLSAGSDLHVGAVYTSDLFYGDRPEITERLDRMGTLGVEMEAAGLYLCALNEAAEALAVCTVSDHLKDGSGDLSAAERETLFADSLQVAIAGLLA